MKKVFAVVMATLVVVGTPVVIVVVGDDPVGAYDDPYPTTVAPNDYVRTKAAQEAKPARYEVYGAYVERDRRGRFARELSSCAPELVRNNFNCKYDYRSRVIPPTEGTPAEFCLVRDLVWSWNDKDNDWRRWCYYYPLEADWETKIGSLHGYPVDVAVIQ